MRSYTPYSDPSGDPLPAAGAGYSILALPRYAARVASEAGIFVLEGQEVLPFSVRRVYWIIGGDQPSEHGHHAHLNPHQLLAGVSGEAVVQLTGQDGSVHVVELNRPDIALLIQKAFWLEVRLQAGAVLLCLSSHRFEDQATVSSLHEFLHPR